MSIATQLPNVALSRTLTLDSTSFMSGNLIDLQDIAPRFSLQTSVNNGNGPITSIKSLIRRHGRSSPTEENEVGTVEWRSSAVGRSKTIVKMFGSNTLTLGALMKCNSMGSKRHFGGLGTGQDIKWVETDGTWQCMPAREKRILAVLHSRIATRGTRIEISTDGTTQLDTIVLTALLVLHGEGDWKAFQNRRNPAIPMCTSPYSMSQPRTLTVAQTPHVTALTLTLSTNSFLNGLLAVEGQLMYAMRTTGNRTSISKYTWEERARLEEFASIEWIDSTFFGTPKSIVTYKGQKQSLEAFMYSHFLGNRLRRFGLPDFLPWLQWVENPPAWACYTHPGRMPLAILDRRFMTAGTRLEVTFEGLAFLDAIVLSTILVIQTPHDWRRNNLGGGYLRRGITDTNIAVTRHLELAQSQSVNDLPSSATETGAHARRIPPGLPRRNTDSRISRISGDSDIPQYSPPPVGLVLDYAEAAYGRSMDPANVASAAQSMINLARMATVPPGRLEEAETDTPMQVPATPPPSYHPPTYSESGHS